MPWFKSDNVNWNTQYPGKTRKCVTLHHFVKSFLSNQCANITRLGDGDGNCLKRRAWSKGRVLWKLIRAWLEVKNKEPKCSCAPPPTPHTWWWNAFVNLPWCPYSELTMLSTLHAWQFASNTMWNAYYTGFF